MKKLLALVVVIVVSCACLLTACVDTNGTSVTIKFDSTGGSKVESVVVDADNKFVMPEDPTRQGYTFTGWTATKDGTEKWTYDASKVTKDITVYAMWEAIELTATFVDGDRVIAEVNFTVDDETIAEPALPSKVGFIGRWSEYELKGESLTISAEWIVDEAFTKVANATEFEQALSSQKPSILVTESFSIALTEVLYIDYTVEIGGSENVVITVSRDSSFTKGNDNIVVKGDNVVIGNIAFNFEVTTGYGLVVGNGGGKYPTVLDDSTIVDSFTMTNVTIMSNTTLSALYFGDGYFTGDFVVEGCLFDGGSVAIVSDHMVDCTFNITNNAFCDTDDSVLLLNYFFVYSPGASKAEGATVSNVEINLVGNSFSGKGEHSSKGYLASGVENHLGDGITFNSEDNRMTLSDEAELTSIRENLTGEVYIVEGFTFVLGEDSYTASDLAE